jgi:formylglycine-generating enzyme required for sulfatase activity/acetyl esterase/lipase
MKTMKQMVTAGVMMTLLLFSAGCASHRTRTSASGPAIGKPWKLPLADNRSLEMVWIPPGTFRMGSPASEQLRKADEGPQTQVTLTKGFWMGRTLVTIGQWKSVMGLDVRAQLGRMLQDETLYDLGGKKQTRREFMGFSRTNDPGQYLANEQDDLPMYFVSWNDAIEFCKVLNQREHANGRLPQGYEFSLPTEAQWEYACRAGTTDTTYAGPLALEGRTAPILDRIAWYAGNSPDGYTGKGFNVAGRTGGPHPVAQKEPNPWGLYDMMGNIWEWCRDWYGPYPDGTVTDPIGPAAGTDRVNRGGSFGSGAGDHRSANRAKNPQPEASAYRGFRLALCPVPTRPPLAAEHPAEILLWPGGAPGSEGKTDEEIIRIEPTGDHVITGVHKPSLTPYLPAPEKATGAAVIVAPGGGHRELWIDHEGYNVARWLSDHGIAAFVLKYRLARGTNSTYTIDSEELADMQRAIRLVRSGAKEWRINPDHVGAMGFSAGGELAFLSAMRFDGGAVDAPDVIDRQSSRPDFQALIYPGNSKRLEPDTNSPPVFLACGENDRPDISEGLPNVYLKFKQVKVPAELHVYSGVGHGFGVRPGDTGPISKWPDRFIEWLGQRGLLGKR